MINLNWPKTNSVRIDVSKRLHSAVDCSISKWIIDLKLSRFICCWAWKFCFNVSGIHCFFNGIDMIKSWSLRRFLCCGFAFVVTSNSLRITLNNHWFKWWNFLFIIVFVYVSRWRIYTINNFTNILGSIVSLTLLWRVPSLIRFLFQIIFNHWLIDTFFVT